MSCWLLPESEICRRPPQIPGRASTNLGQGKNKKLPSLSRGCTESRLSSSFRFTEPHHLEKNAQHAVPSIGWAVEGVTPDFIVRESKTPHCGRSILRRTSSARRSSGRSTYGP